MMTKKQIIGWLGVGSSIATIMGLYFNLFPVQTTPSSAPTTNKPETSQVQIGGTGNTQIGPVTGNVTINPPSPLPRANTPPKSPADGARSELQQLGVQWGSDGFIAAIVDGDVRTVELFLKGGMKLSLNYKGASAAVYALQPKANNRQAMMQLFLGQGFDPNATLLDARIMRTLGSLPPHFEHRLLSTEYAAWQKQFAGPSDLWLVIRACYAGPEKDDFMQLRQLAAKGARFDISLAFLREYERIWGNTPVYWEVRNEVERLAKIPISKKSGA